MVGGVTATVVGNTFTATLPAAQTATVTVSGGNVITRTVRAAVPGSVVVDVFGAGFDLDYYRQLARSAKDGHNYALSHWTQPPRIYFQTVDDRGVAVPDSLITETAAVIENIAGEMTGKFGLAGIDRGSDTRESVRGWITVKWLSAPATTSCGDALVGVEQGGVIRLYYRTPACMCASLIRHETGHALGFWHAGGRLDIMNGDTLASCTATISAREREYMHYIYSRKVGNVDPDSDP